MYMYHWITRLYSRNYHNAVTQLYFRKTLKREKKYKNLLKVRLQNTEENLKKTLVGHRHDLDPTLLWLWCSPAAIAPIEPLAWELPYAVGLALGEKKKSLVLLFKIPYIMERSFVNGYTSVWVFQWYSLKLMSVFYGLGSVIGSSISNNALRVFIHQIPAIQHAFSHRLDLLLCVCLFFYRSHLSMSNSMMLKIKNSRIKKP